MSLQDISIYKNLFTKLLSTCDKNLKRKNRKVTKILKAEEDKIKYYNKIFCRMATSQLASK